MNSMSAEVQPSSKAASEEPPLPPDAAEIEAAEVHPPQQEQEASQTAPTFAQKIDKKTRALLQRWSSQIARRNLILLAGRGNIAQTLSDIPEEMHKVARQTRLVIEFVDDFRSGRYREMPWWAMAVAASAMLYTINPADVVPNFLPLVGTMDDLVVVAVAVRLLQNELKRYCEFKGYDVAQYF